MAWMNSILSTFVTGFAMSAVLIMAIGSQNLFVLRQGFKREHVGPIVLFCGCANAVLIAAGVGGVGAILAALPQLTLALTLGGALFLSWYGFKAFQRMLSPDIMAFSAQGGITLGRAMAAAAGFTFLNPHAYLDTVLLQARRTHRLFGRCSSPAPQPRALPGSQPLDMARASWRPCSLVRPHGEYWTRSSVSRCLRSRYLWSRGWPYEPLVAWTAVAAKGVARASVSAARPKAAAGATRPLVSADRSLRDRRPAALQSSVDAAEN